MVRERPEEKRVCSGVCGTWALSRSLVATTALTRTISLEHFFLIAKPDPGPARGSGQRTPCRAS